MAATESKSKPGGAANVMANLLALDVEVHGIGFEGKDQRIESLLIDNDKCIWHYVDEELIPDKNACDFRVPTNN